MNWHQKIVVQLVLLVARFVARIGGETELADELKVVATHINVAAPEPERNVLRVASDRLVAPVTELPRD